MNIISKNSFDPPKVFLSCPTPSILGESEPWVGKVYSVDSTQNVMRNEYKKNKKECNFSLLAKVLVTFYAPKMKKFPTKVYISTGKMCNFFSSPGQYCCQQEIGVCLDFLVQ